MPQFLYAAAFDGGLIKVGRSANPHKRIGQHEDRLSCAGIQLLGRYIAECLGCIATAEAALIATCAANASVRHEREWFRGLVFGDVCGWIDAASTNLTAPAEHTKLKLWLDGEHGRYRALATALGVTKGRVSQMARDGVPKSHLIAVRNFTGGAVSIEEMLEHENCVSLPRGQAPAMPHREAERAA
jgi:predicted XRE-type DNA-binding protein